MPEHWELVRLGKLGRLVRGVSYKKQDVTNDAILRYLPVLRATNIQDRQLILDEELVYVKAEKVSDSQLLRRGDVIIAMSSGSKSVVGKAAQLNMDWKGSFGAFCAVFRHNAMAESFFVGNVFQTKNYRKHLLREARGTNINNLSKNHILDYQLLLPPLPEQRAIASILGAIQEAKFARQKEIALERERKAALMDYLFSHGTKDEPCKQTEIGEIPESWEWVRIEEVVRKSIRDGVHQTPTYVEDGVPFITAKDIVGNKICFASCAYISAEEHTTLSKRVKPEVGDVLLTKVGTVGNVALVDTIQQFSIFVQIALIKPKSDKVDSGFLLYALESDMGQKEINRNCAQSTMRFIGVQKISNVRVPIPSLLEQAEIATTLQACDTKIAALEQETARLDELFHAMLEELMTGQRFAVPLIDAELPN